jgi:molybdopterin converting factor small subunit
MKLRVELQGYLDQYSPNDSNEVFDYEVEDGATVLDLMRRLHIPEEMAAVFVVSEEARESSFRLSDGDRVTLIPPLGGG